LKRFGRWSDIRFTFARSYTFCAYWHDMGKALARQAGRAALKAVRRFEGEPAFPDDAEMGS
jgi:hypothetical protein